MTILSPFLYGLSELIGLANAMKMVEAYGGRPKYIPQKIGIDHELAVLIGIDAAQKLAAEYPSTTITIPLSTTGDHARQAAARRARIRELKDQGLSHNQIARELRTTDRTVRKVLGAEVDDRQQGLF